MIDRTHYAQRDTRELERKLAEVRDRMTRADTMEAALQDAFQQQELCAVLVTRGVVI